MFVRTHILQSLAFLVALTIVFASSSAQADGFPAFSDLETVILGPKVHPSSATSQGTWEVRDAHVHLSESHDSRQNFWFPKSPEATVKDGMIRARLTVKGKLDGSLLFRVKVPEDSAAGLSGYGLGYSGDSMQLYRYDDGAALPMTDAEDTSLDDRSVIEIVVWLVGPNTTDQVYDGKSLKHIRTLTAFDTSYRSGQIGFRAYKKQSETVAFTLLSVLPALAEYTPKLSPLGDDRYGVLEGAAFDALVAADKVKDLPPTSMVSKEDPAATRWLNIDWNEEVIERSESEVVVKVSAQRAEILTRMGATVSWFDYPKFRWRDRDFLELEGQTPPELKVGYDLSVSYKDAAMVESLLRGYERRYPKIAKVVEIGRSHGDRPILALKISDHVELSEDEPAVLLNAAHHGVELLATEFALDAIQELIAGYENGEKNPVAWVDALEIWVVPLVNPDGNHDYFHTSTWFGRKNGRDTTPGRRDDATYDVVSGLLRDGEKSSGSTLVSAPASNESAADGVFRTSRGVDLNRNYPFRWNSLGEKGSSSDPRHRWYRGPSPGSEPETQAMMRLADSEHFVASISYHTYGTVILAPYTIDDVENPDNNEAWDIAKYIAQRTEKQPNGRKYKVRRKIYSVDGVDQDWFRAAHGTTALLVEGAYHNPRSEKRAKTIVANRGTWRYLLKKVVEGPRVSGRVVDENGHPVVAQITVEEVGTKENEVWNSRCKDGRFDRLLSKNGSYTLVVEAHGLQKVTTKVRVKGDTVVDDIVLPSGPRADGVAAETTSEGVRSNALVKQLCSDPQMCALDTYCAALDGACVEAGPQAYVARKGACTSISSLPPEVANAGTVDTVDTTKNPTDDATDPVHFEPDPVPAKGANDGAAASSNRTNGQAGANTKKSNNDEGASGERSGSEGASSEAQSDGPGSKTEAPENGLCAVVSRRGAAPISPLWLAVGFVGFALLRSRWSKG